MLTPAFHFNIMEDFSKSMKKHASILIDSLKENPSKQIVRVIEEATFYSLCETSFGIEFASRDESNAFFAPMGGIMKAYFQKISSQNPLTRLEWYYQRTESGKLYRSSLDELNRQVLVMINKAKKDLETGETKLHKGKRSFLDQMVFEQAERGELTDEQMVGECNTILLAGHSTTTGTIAFCIYYLCKHQDIQERLYKEVADHLKDKDFDDIDVGSLPYLGMVIKETLRIQPPAAFIGRKLSEPMEADGHILPAGTNLDISIWWLHRDPEHWENAEDFGSIWDPK